MPIAELADVTFECPEPSLWQCFDEQSAEVEVLEFMYSLVRALKPKLVVETGSCRGLSACYIGKALRDNKRGKLITCEIDPKYHEMTRELITKARLLEQVECVLSSSLDLDIAVDQPIDLLFSDSMPNIRMKELEKFDANLSTQSLIAIHDVNSGFHAQLRETVLKQDKDRKLSVVLLPTPRGLALCQKREGRV